MAYLLFAKWLFGLRGGGKAGGAEHEEDTGWAPIERATPMPPARGRNGVADHGSRPAQPEPSGANGRLGLMAVREVSPGPRIDYEPAAGLA